MRPNDAYEEYQRRSENEDYKVVAEQMFDDITQENFNLYIAEIGINPNEPDTRDPLDIAYENGELYMDEDNTYPYDEGMISE